MYHRDFVKISVRFANFLYIRRYRLSYSPIYEKNPDQLMLRFFSYAHKNPNSQIRIPIQLESFNFNKKVQTEQIRISIQPGSFISTYLLFISLPNSFYQYSSTYPAASSSDNENTFIRFFTVTSLLALKLLQVLIVAWIPSNRPSHLHSLTNTLPEEEQSKFITGQKQKVKSIRDFQQLAHAGKNVSPYNFPKERLQPK